MRVCIPPPLSEKSIWLEEHPTCLNFYGDYLLVGQSNEILFIECETGKVIWSSNIQAKNVDWVLFIGSGKKLDGLLITEH